MLPSTPSVPRWPSEAIKAGTVAMVKAASPEGRGDARVILEPHWERCHCASPGRWTVIASPRLVSAA